MTLIPIFGIESLDCPIMTSEFLNIISISKIIDFFIYSIFTINGNTKSKLYDVANWNRRISKFTGNV